MNSAWRFLIVLSFGLAFLAPREPASRTSVPPLTNALAVTSLGGGVFTIDGSNSAIEVGNIPDLRIDWDPATGTATLKGVARFKGKVPKQRKINPDSDPVCAKMHEGSDFRSEAVLVNKDGMLRNVFVWISKGLESTKFPVPDEAVTLDQKGCRFEPHVQGVMVKQKIFAVNSDATTHNLHAMGRLNENFNFTQSTKGAKKALTFERKETMVFVKCDIHPWMGAYFGVVTNPFHTTTGADGAFELKNLPPGTYTVSAWHEKYGIQKKEVTVGDGKTEEIEFSFKKRRRRKG